MIRTCTKALTIALSTFILGAVPSLALAQVKPALTRDVSTATPVEVACSGFYNTGQNFVKCDLMTVPAGKRLVVEAVSYYVTLASSIQATQVLFGRGSANVSNFLFGAKARAMTPELVYSDATYRSYMGTQMIRLYLEENEIFSAIVYFTSNGANYQQSFSASGFLVDK